MCLRGVFDDFLHGFSSAFAQPYAQLYPQVWPYQTASFSASK